MKKVVTLLLIAICLVSCNSSGKKQEQKEEEEKFSLVGKTYAAPGKGVSGDDISDVYRFKSETEIEYTFRYDDYQGQIISLEEITYKLDYPNITIYKTDGEIKEEGTFINKDKFRTTVVYSQKIREYIRKE